MDPNLMSDALDDFAADEREQAARFPLTRAAFAEMLAADYAFGHAEGLYAELDAACTLSVQKLREALADDTAHLNKRETILTMHECGLRTFVKRLLAAEDRA